MYVYDCLPKNQITLDTDLKQRGRDGERRKKRGVQKAHPIPIA